MICDFAEYYKIYNMRDIDPRTASILACGLRGSSRVLMAISGQKTTLETKLTAMMVDNLSWLVWSKTVDGEHNRNRPKSIYQILEGNTEENNTESVKFKTSEEFEKAREQILKGK